MSYRDAPRSKPGPVEECCSCSLHHQKPIPCKGEVDVHLELGKAVPVVKHWCGLCGRYLSTKDQDKYFPSPYWVDNRPVQVQTEPIEDE
jgi:hypothetical protein